MKVLFVDEDWEIDTLARVLQARYPEDTFEVVDGLFKAKQRIWSEEWDILVLDIMMPVDGDAVPRSIEDAGLLSGVRLAELIAGDSACPNSRTPVVFLTGLSAGESSELADLRARQAQCFLPKPIHPDYLHSQLVRLVASSKK
jgi:CheY-like chemotaxis protein